MLASHHLDDRAAETPDVDLLAVHRFHSEQLWSHPVEGPASEEEYPVMDSQLSISSNDYC